MKKSVKRIEAVVTAIGRLCEIVIGFVGFLKEFGGDVGECFYLLGEESDKTLLREFAAKLVEEWRKMKQVAANFFRIIVNWNLPLAEMIAAGRYDSVDPGITEAHFPHNRSRGTTRPEVEIVSYDWRMSNEEIDRDLERRVLRDAELPELIAFGATYKDEQRKGPIVARGSVRQLDLGYRGVACLHGNASGRSLLLVDLLDGWHGDWRFAAVRNSLYFDISPGLGRNVLMSCFFHPPSIFPVFGEC
jgi:hypothetical protein